MLRSLPDLAYNISKSATDVTLIYGKNLWRRAEILSEFKSKLALFDEYIVKDGEKPEDIAYRIYNNGFYGWTILIANDITNYYEQWPRSAQQLEDYVTSKYDNPAAIKQYETNELKDSNGNVIVPAGKVVPSTYSISYYDGTSTVTATPVSSVSNYTYEANLNAKKEKIQLIRPEYIEEFVAAYEKILRKSGGITVGVSRDGITM
jgi:hypothetical protein